MKRIVTLAVCTGLAACQPQGRTEEEEANLAAVNRMTELFNEHMSPAEYFDDYYAAEMQWQGFMSFPPYVSSAGREEIKEIVQRNHELASDRKITIHSLTASGHRVVKEYEINGTRRDIREVAIFDFEDGRIAEARTYSIAIPRPGAPTGRSGLERANEEAIQRWFRLFNEKPPDWIAEVFTEDLEYQPVFAPSGPRTVGRAAMKALNEQAARRFADLRMSIRQTVIEGNQAVVEARWSATASMDIPEARVQQGQQMRQKIAFFVTFRDGKIAVLREYASSTS